MQLSAIHPGAGVRPAAQSSHAQRILSSLNQQRAVGRFCDAALNMGEGLVYLAHRSILACFSDLFQQSDVSPVPCAEFCLEECPNRGLELLLNFIYTGELRLSRENLAEVQHAAASLCVPDVLLLCQRFREATADPPPAKRKRGRPRKTVSDAAPRCSVKEEAAKDESGFEPTVSGAPPTTTTRSGRRVKGPKRLVTDEAEGPNPGVTVCEANTSKALTEPAEGGGGSEEGNKSSGTPGGENQANKLDVDTNDNGVSLQTAAEDSDGAGGFDCGTEGSDQDYVPGAEAPPPAPSTSAARRRRAHVKTVKAENGEAPEKDPKKKKKKKKKEEEEESVLCPICDKSFKSKYYLKVHNRRHTGERPFACSKCGKRYFRKENLLIHEIRDCARLQSYSCGMCPATFTGKEQLRLHVVSHTGDMPHKCSLCTEQFMLKKYMTMHMMKVHGYPKPHACPQCTKTFLTRTELRVHEAAKHRGEKPFVCEECGHRASSRNGLQMHIKAIHRNERPFVCNLCGHAFSQKNNLNMHLRIHSGEKPFQCHLCGKTFRTQASLDKHNRTHTGERPFGCEVCEQRFTEKGALLRHKASKHEEGRPHSCHICGKTFKAREQLRVHLRRHKGMRKFECIDCGYKFTRQAHLRRHVLIHKRNENYNPRQRKLRNVVVQDVGGANADEDTQTPEASLSDSEPADFNPETCNIQEAADPRADSQPTEAGLDSNCIMRVVIGPGDTVLEEVVSDQNLGPVEAEEGFPVTEVLQSEQLVTEAYESTVDMEEIAQEMSEGKS